MITSFDNLFAAQRRDWRPRRPPARSIQYPRDRVRERWWDLPFDLDWPLTMEQEAYIDILFREIGFSRLDARTWLQREYGSPYVDRLSWLTKSRIIDRLKELKTAQREAAAALHARAEEEASGNLFDEMP